MHKEGGIIFYRTTKLEKLHEFYINLDGVSLWLDQGGCRIYKFGNMLFGFCQREETDRGALLTFFYPDREGVDKVYEKLKDRSKAGPADNPQYRIYHFYSVDPDNRPIEFQYFWDKID